MTRILVVDDDPRLLKALKINLVARGYQVISAATGSEGVRAAADQHPDLVVLDLGLPDLDGKDVLSGIRGWSSVPIIVLTARDSPIDKVAVLDSGADDYITKPFAMEELLARVRLALRHAANQQHHSDAPSVQVGSLHIDLANTRITRDHKDVHLTPTEWRILEILVRAQGRLVRQDELLREVWGPEYLNQGHYLRVYMAQIRRKLEPDPAHPRYLLTESGLGYRFDPPSPRIK
ncbi:response regulator [Corynebacterium poyangense]|uniref:Transcriptional regulatory protein KdpE n=1 Tax=Corynebacterium poyangense TaxID=2684405 RepID=A0A7H0SQ62_9CORY|nr:response regulator [Corynebacterium poyangense]MBZ8178374.1 response regulator [Corynebacterium poyangense]QNQ90687.1 response regulator [Corynebacterium poyangense]